MRVLHVLGRMDPGGIETWLLQVLRHIDRWEVELDICALDARTGAYDSQVLSLGNKLIRCQLGPNPLAFSRRFRKVLRSGRYDAVHSHLYYFSGLILRVARSEGVRLRIAHSHNTNDGKRSGPARRFYRRWMRNWIRKHASHGLACSAEAASSLFGSRWHADRRFGVLHYGIELDAFRAPSDRVATRAEFAIPTGAPIIGHVGRFVEQKNHAFLLEVAAELIKLLPEAHFLLVGDGPLRLSMEKRSRQLGISGQVRFAGARLDVPRLMRGCMDSFVFPSLWEGFALVLLEAQAAGLPVVTADTVPREAIVAPDFVQCLSIGAGPKAWAVELCARLSQSPPDPEDALRRVSERGYSIRRSVQALEEIYSSSVAHRAAS